MKVFITGASTGIGEALARRYGSQEHIVGLAARREDLLQALAKSLPATCSIHPLDIADTQAVERAAQEFISRHGAPDVVIANAGISVGTRGDAMEDIRKLERVMAVNVTGMAATLAAFAPAMKQAGSGTLCGIASVAGFRGLPGAGAYSASKAAAISWLESLRTELHGTGVSVVTVCPGYIDTPMTQANSYRMPFLLPADEFARRCVRAIEGKRRLAVIPWQMAIVGSLLRIMPAWLYDRAAARAPRKSRDVAI
jgi:short-subunit dehydrogenase